MNYQAQKLVLNLTHMHVAEVRGIGKFPIAMLLYSHAVPLGERDALEIERSLNPMLRPPRPFSVRLIKYTAGSMGWAQHEIDRWRSFHCTLTPVSPWEHPADKENRSGKYPNEMASYIL